MKPTTLEAETVTPELVQPTNPQDAPLVRESTPMQLISMAVTGGADPAQLEKLMDLQERWERNQAAKAFGAALMKFQSLCPIIHKSREVAFAGKHMYNFAGLDDIMRAITPILNQCGLCVSYSTEIKEGQMLVKCKITCGIHSEVSEVQMPIPSDARVNDTQKMAMALSYAKRYALCAALNIVTSNEDCDAAGLSATITEEQAAKLDDLLSQLAPERKARFYKYVGTEKLIDIKADRFDDIYKKLVASVKDGGR